jgi:arylamine N-acetyltransferase
VASVLIDTGDEHQPLGKLTIFNEKLQKRLPGAEPEKTTIKTEKERLRILREQFGLGDIPDDAESVVRHKGFALP